MQLGGQPLALSEIASVALDGTTVEVSPSAHPRVLASRNVIEDIIARDATVYGVNTGFGKLADCFSIQTDRAGAWPENTAED